MSSSKDDFIDIVLKRGFLYQSTDLDTLKRASKDLIGYIGFDCTAQSLHVGSLIQIMLLRWLQKTGNTSIVLIGGGTTKIGDPSGKDTSRKLLTEDDIKSNTKSIEEVFKTFLNFNNNQNKSIMVNNDQWLNKLNYISFLREYGKHFSINRMLSFDSVKLRLEREQTLSFLEFNYMVIKAYNLSSNYKSIWRKNGKINRGSNMVIKENVISL